MQGARLQLTGTVDDNIYFRDVILCDRKILAYERVKAIARHAQFG